MKNTKWILVISIFMVTACTAVRLEPANFAWPIETVITTDDTGAVKIDRYSTEFNASNLFKAEFGDSAEVANQELRIIRDQLGYYVITAKRFMNVYVFEAEDGALEQINKIFITKDGLTNPAFNQRPPNIELLNNGEVYIIDSKGLKRK